MSEFVEDDIIYYTDIQTGKVWKRTGGCSQCGDCCTDTGGWGYNHIFEKYDGNYDTNNPLTQVVAGRCAYFRWREDGKSECTGRDTSYYLNGCKFAPTKPIQVADWPNCTYMWTEVNPITEP